MSDMELARKAHAAFAAGWEKLCLTCQQGFNSLGCPRCWWMLREPDSSGIAYGLTPQQAYQWVCIQLGATRTKGNEARWLAVRDALDKAITESDQLPI